MLGVGAWVVERVLSPDGRVATLATLALIGVIGAGIYLAMLRLLPKRASSREAALEPSDPDLATEL